MEPMLLVYRNIPNRKCTILLDRNVISKIKDLLAGKQVNEVQRVAIEQLDTKYNTICSILSVIEGESAQKESGQKMYQTAMSDANAIAQFFREARTDAQAYNSSAFLGITAPGINFEYDNDLYVAFLKDVYKELFDSIDPPKESKGEIKAPDYLAGVIIDLAEKYSVSPGHPVVLCLLGAAYRNVHAKKIIKVHEVRKAYAASDEKMYNRKIFNTLNDMQAFGRVSSLILHFRELAQNSPMNDQPSIGFFSFDEGLVGFLSCFTLISASVQKIATMESPGVHRFTKTVNVEKAFPALLKDSSMYRRIERLGGEVV